MLPRRGRQTHVEVMNLCQRNNPHVAGPCLKLSDVFGPMFEAMLNGEMENHLGYEANERSEKETANRRNGYTHKTLKTSAGEGPVDVLRDRDGSFDPSGCTKALEGRLFH